MEEKNEFSDILLERESEAKASRFKKIALIVGAFILTFLLVLVVMKILNKPSEKDSNSRLVIPPKDTENKVQKQNDPLFKQVPIIKQDNKKESFEEMVRKLKAKESQRIAEEKKRAVSNAPEIKDIENKDEIKKEIIIPINTAEKPPKEISKKIKKQKEPKVKAVTPIKPKPVKIVKKTAKKDISKKPKTTIPKIPSPKTNTKSGNVSKGTYIQVLASKDAKPDKKYLNSLAKKGYSYHLHKTTIKGQKYLKILVGPYSGYSDAKKALSKVQKDLNKNAFIFTLK